MNDSFQNESSETNLVILAQDGDVQAFSQLMETIQPRLLAQAIAFCKDPELARDLVQETMLAAWKSIKKFDGSCQIFTWIYVILQRQHSRANRWFSRRLKLATPNQTLSASRQDSTLPEKEDSINLDEAEILRSMVSALPRKHQEVIRLRFYAEASETETAASLGISVGTVKSRQHVALQKLQRMKEKLNLLRIETH